MRNHRRKKDAGDLMSVGQKPKITHRSVSKPVASKDIGIKDQKEDTRYDVMDGRDVLQSEITTLEQRLEAAKTKKEKDLIKDSITDLQSELSDLDNELADLEVQLGLVKSKKVVALKSKATKDKDEDSDDFSGIIDEVEDIIVDEETADAINVARTYMTRSEDLISDGSDSIIGHTRLKEIFMTNVVAPTKLPHLFKTRVPNRALMLVGPPGTGKCVTGDTYVLTTEGMVQIGSLYSTSDIESDFPMEKTIESFDFDNFLLQKTSKIYQKKAVPIKKLKTHIGLELNGTPHHRIIVLSDDGDLEWRNLENIIVGDTIAVRVGSNFEPKDMVLPRFDVSDNIRLIKTTKLPDIPNYMSDDLAYVLGLLVGDGSLRTPPSVVRFSNNDTALISKFNDKIHKIYGIQCVAYDYPQSTIDVKIHSTIVKSHLQFIGLHNTLAHEKEIPFSVLQSSFSSQCSFLKGLFDSDGSISPNGNSIELSYSSSSKKLITQVQLILLHMGIVSRVRMKTTLVRDHYVLVIYNEYISLFSIYIGFESPKKKERLTAYLDNGKKRNTNVGIIPNIALKLKILWQSVPMSIRLEHGHTSRNNQSLDGISFKQFDKYINNRAKIPIKKLEVLLIYLTKIYPDIINNELFNKLFTLKSGLFYTSVTSNIDSIDDVFDFVVPNTHSFVANGIINHNTDIVKGYAKDLGYNFFEIRSNDIFSQYVGKAEKLADALFKIAIENEPAIIFIDEAEGMWGKRTSDHNAKSRKVTDEFLQSISELEKLNINVYVTGATNNPELLDPAISRRFLKIPVLMPSEIEREAIWKAKMVGINSVDIDYSKLAKLTDGYSGSDIHMMSKLVMTRPTEEVLEGLTIKDFEFLDIKEKDLRIVDMTDFEEIIENTAPSVSETEIKKIDDWFASFKR